jgi:hypothetical protein
MRPHRALGKPAHAPEHAPVFTPCSFLPAQIEAPWQGGKREIMAMRAQKRIAGLVLMVAASAPLANGKAETAAIGRAVLVEHEVSGRFGAQTRRLAEGSGVFTNELIATQAASMARLTFVDATNLALGPDSEVRLDRFVFDPARGARSVALRTTLGAFRFVTGDSDPRAFAITTPIAAIGVRGTALDFKNTPGRTLVVLESGAAIVCLRSAPSRCVQLLPGTYALASAKRIEGPLSGTIPFRFADLCAPGSAAICRFTKTVHATIDQPSRQSAGNHEPAGSAEANAAASNGGPANPGAGGPNSGNGPGRGKAPGG